MKDKTLWYPYAQMKSMAAPYEVESARGVYLHLSDGRRLIDAVSSWWCVIHGYNHPELTKAAKDQYDKMAHVMLGGLTHRPARDLAEKLVEITPEGLNHTFFSDSGSVGVEVSLKMAIQYWSNLGRPEKRKIAALKKAYHGDTTGAMSVCDPVEGMHSLFSPLLPRQYFLEAPRGGFEAEQSAVQKDLDALGQLLEARHNEIAAFIVEPLMQAAGGFNFYSPQYLKGARELCERYGALLIFDEVATGFGRTGAMFAANKAQVTPDIMILGKALTCGYTGHAATLATDKVFDAFLSDDPDKAFMHGPTFMGNPVACAVALKGVEIFEREGYMGKISRIESLLKENLLSVKSPAIADVRVLGATGVIEAKDASALEGAQKFAVERGVWLRPFGNYLYTMPPYIISDDELLKVVQTMREWFE